MSVNILDVIHRTLLGFILRNSVNLLKLTYIAGVVVAAWCVRHYRRETYDSLMVWIRAFSQRRWLVIALVTLLPIVFRLVLLVVIPIPEPNISDEYVNLVAADTFASGRLANPTHPFWVHFETTYVLQYPTYAASYPPGQGIVLAVSQRLTGVPWFGVLLAAGAMCGSVCWALQGMLDPAWALLGGLVSVVDLTLFNISNPSELSYWINSYWGGAITAVGGALLFGALLHLLRRGSRLNAILVSAGWSVVFFTRPYEAVVLGIALAVVMFVWLWRANCLSFRAKLIQVIFPMTCVLAICASTFLFYNYKVTGNLWKHPLQLSKELYGVPQSFYWQSPVPEPPLRYQSARDLYDWQLLVYKEMRQSLPGISFPYGNLWYFFFGPVFSIPLLALPWGKLSRFVGLLVGFVLFGLAGSTLYPFYLPHYSAPYTVIFILLIVLGVRAMFDWQWKGRRIGEFLVIALFAAATVPTLGTTARLFMKGGIRANQGGRSFVEAELRRMGGRHLVFVHYGPKHNFNNEWLYNAAKIDDSQIVWAREWTKESNEALIHYFANRSVWTVDTDVTGDAQPALVPLHTP
jgi:hypothetical protein